MGDRRVAPARRAQRCCVATPAARRSPILRFHRRDRKSTRLNSSHDQISYAVFCLKKKNVNRVVKRGGALVIPSFAIRRTETFMYYPGQLEGHHRTPRVPADVDCPLALTAHDLYLQ